MITRTSFAVFVLCLLTLLTAVAVGEVNPMNTGEVAQSAKRIALVRCLSTKTRRVEQYGQAIFTFTTFKVLEEIVGELPDTFTLRFMGGRVGNTILDSPLLPVFEPGEELVIHLGPDNRDGYPVLFGQGLLEVKEDRLSGKKVVTSPISGLPLLQAENGKSYVGKANAIPLEDLIYSLRAYVNGNVVTTPNRPVSPAN